MLCDFGYNVYFTPAECFVHDRTSKKVIEIGRRQGGLYILNQFKELIIATSSVNLSSFSLSSSSLFLFVTFSLGHVFASHLKFLAFTGVLGTLTIMIFLIVVLVN